MKNKKTYYHESGKSLFKFCAGDLSLYRKIVYYLVDHNLTVATDKIVENCKKNKKAKIRCADGEYFYKKIRRLGLDYYTVLWRYYRKGRDPDAAINWLLQRKEKENKKCRQ